MPLGEKGKKEVDWNLKLIRISLTVNCETALKKHQLLYSWPWRMKWCIYSVLQKSLLCISESTFIALFTKELRGFYWYCLVSDEDKCCVTTMTTTNLETKKFWGSFITGQLKLPSSCQIANSNGVCIGNSMISSDIWHRYHEWYFKIVIRNFPSR